MPESKMTDMAVVTEFVKKAKRRYRIIRWFPEHEDFDINKPMAKRFIEPAPFGVGCMGIQGFSAQEIELSADEARLFEFLIAEMQASGKMPSSEGSYLYVKGETPSV